MIENILPSLSSNGRLSPEEATASDASLRGTNLPQSDIVRPMIRAFIEGRGLDCHPPVEGVDATTAAAEDLRGETLRPPLQPEDEEATTATAAGGMGGLAGGPLEEQIGQIMGHLRSAMRAGRGVLGRGDLMGAIDGEG